MAIIKNNTIKRGDLLKSAELNAEFTAVNTAFTMDEDNFRNEALDQPSFDTQAISGKSGIILKAAETIVMRSSTLTVNANTNAVTVAPQAATEIGEADLTLNPVACLETDILRVYWQYSFKTFGDDTDPAGIDRQGLCWAVWLEWKTSSGGAYAPVPNQGALNVSLTASAGTRYGNSSAALKATSIDYHVIQYRAGAADHVVYPERRGGYGQFFYKFTGDTTIHGLRLMINGIYEPVYSTSLSRNALISTEASGPVHNIEVYTADLSYLLMRDD
jgi:hypothetical protein|tara:strand:- start:254 stop:1075 length:822 start_codon:yes stop_codon:yes gene_type:complete